MSSSVPFQPKIVDVHTVNPEIIAVRIAAQETTRGQQVAYEAEAGDRIRKDGWVVRNDEFIGVLVGAEKDTLRLPDQIHGLPLDTSFTDDLSNYRISSAQDSNYNDSVAPVAVYRKSKPMGSQLAFVSPLETVSPLTHTIYLKLPTPLQVGETYDIDFLGEQLSDVSYRYEPTVDRSEAVHVSQIGFDPGDGAKVAFLSQWMGNGGDLKYAEGTKFWLIDEETGAQVYEGQIELSRAKDESEDLRDINYNLTDVYMMDFSDFQTEGTYRVAVDGVGTSFSFEIGETTWEDAFYVTARGFFHQRSGIALEQPYTDYERPRPFHPDDGVKVYQSTVPIMDTNMGLNLQNVKAFDALVETKTDVLVPDAWGGWFDAGDWDRRIQNLEATRNLLELAEINPDYFQGVDLNILESDNHIADIVDEALWGLDVFRRLQTPEGGIPGGIESAGHPKTFEASWQESQTVMVYGPGIWSSYIYAATASQAALVLATIDPVRSQMYQDSALRAMAWAEQEYSNYTGPTSPSIDNWRNLAALELYRTTQDANWHQLFLETTAFTDPEADVIRPQVHNHEEAAYIYAQLDLPDVEPTVKENAYQALLRAGNAEINNIEQTGFKWQKHPETRVRWGASMGHPDVTTLLRAHQISGDNKYLNAAILGLQFTAGANPDNLVFTTGLGQRSPQDPLIVDVRTTGSSVIPPGITVYGPYNYHPLFDHPSWRFFADDLFPTIHEWPTTENYFDIYALVPVTEYTVHQTMAPTSYAFGYLAAIDQTELTTDIESDDSGKDAPDNGDSLTNDTPVTNDNTGANDPDNDDSGDSPTNDTPVTEGDTPEEGDSSTNEETPVTEDGANNDGADNEDSPTNDTPVTEDGTPEENDVPATEDDTPEEDTGNDGTDDDDSPTNEPPITENNTPEEGDSPTNDAPVTEDGANNDGAGDEDSPTNDIPVTEGDTPEEDTSNDGTGDDDSPTNEPPVTEDDTASDAPDNEDTSDENSPTNDIPVAEDDTPEDNTPEEVDSPTNAPPVTEDDANNDGTGEVDSPTNDAPVAGVTIIGEKAAERLEGSAGNDTIDGRGLDDMIYGLAGDDLLIGNWGWDTLDGGEGNDTLEGGSGQNTYTGGTGQDTFVLSAKTTQDTITDFVANEDRLDISDITSLNTLDANGDGLVDDAFLTPLTNGNLVLNLSSLGGGTVILAGQASLANSFDLTYFSPPDTDSNAPDSGNTDDAVDDSGSDDVGAEETPTNDIPGTEDEPASDAPGNNDTGGEEPPTNDAPVTGVTIIGQKAAEHLEGSAGNDTIDGHGLDDTIYGLAGDDLLIGSWGWDTLNGGEGNDTLEGGPGRDIYTGGAGQDTFVLSAKTTQDTITDFVGDEDWIDISDITSPHALDTNGDGLVDDAFLTPFGGGHLMLDLRSLGGKTLILEGQAGLVNSFDLTYFSPPDTGSTAPDSDSTATDDTTPDNSGNSDTADEETPTNDTPIDSGNNAPDEGDASTNDTPVTESDIASDTPGNNDADGEETPTNDAPVAGVTIIGEKAVEHLEGSAGNDTIDGRGLDDTIYGLAGDDLLIGNWGWDTLDGGEGNDKLVGGPGQDTYTGGAGEDVFVLHNSGEQTFITDFEVNSDRLDLSVLGISFGVLDANNDGLVDEAFLAPQGQGVVLNLSAFGGGPVLLQGVANLEQQHFI